MNKRDRKESLLTAGEKLCPICGKVFYVHDAEVWAYKAGYSWSKRTYFCSWGCMRKAEEKKKGRQQHETKTEKEKHDQKDRRAEQ